MLKESPKGSYLFYMVLLNNETCYIFNIKKIDWSKINTFDWWIKETQVDPNSPYHKYKTFSLPTSLAMKTVDCSKYFEMYNAL